MYYIVCTISLNINNYNFFPQKNLRLFLKIFTITIGINVLKVY